MNAPLGASDVPRLSWLVRARRAEAVAMLAIAMTFVTLMTVVIAGSLVLARAGGRARRSVQLNSALPARRQRRGGRGVPRRKYRLQPGPVPLAAHHAAEADVDQAWPTSARWARRPTGAWSPRCPVSTSGLRGGRPHPVRRGRPARADVGGQRHRHRRVNPVFDSMQTEISGPRPVTRPAPAPKSGLPPAGHVVLGLDIASLLAGLGAHPARRHDPAPLAGTASRAARRRTATRPSTTD